LHPFTRRPRRLCRSLHVACTLKYVDYSLLIFAQCFQQSPWNSRLYTYDNFFRP
jgi:hypothetical protein